MPSYGHTTEGREMPHKQLGAEIEYPIVPSGSNKMAAWGEKSRGLHSRMSDDGYSVPYGHLEWDGTVGAEIVSDPLDPDTLGGWYGDVIEDVEETYGSEFCPTGLVGGSTAGLHIHVSEITREQAQTLSRWSSQEWLQVFACSSIANQNGNPDFRVFRGGQYCRLSEEIRGSRYYVVNERDRLGGHYEWRLPEPCTTEHFGHIVEFLARFIDDPEGARTYAMEMLDDPSVTLTSAERAKAVGITSTEQREVLREPHPETRNFWDAVVDDSSAPYIKKVRIGSDVYYAFHGSATPPFMHNGVVYDKNTVLDATNLSRVYGTRRDDVVRLVQGGGDAYNETEATDLLKDVASKKA